MDETKVVFESITEADNGANDDSNVIDCREKTNDYKITDNNNNNNNNDIDSDKKNNCNTNNNNNTIVVNYTSLQFVPTCDMYDKYLDTIRVLTLPIGQQWISYGSIKQFCGPIVTVKCYENNTIVKEILRGNSSNYTTLHQNTTTNGSLQNIKKVLLIDGGGSNYCALIGDQLVQAAIDSQMWCGIIVYGYVRDVSILQTLSIGIVALGCTPRKSNPLTNVSGTGTGGQINIPLCINNISIHPTTDDIAFVDLDGIIIIQYNQIVM